MKPQKESFIDKKRLSILVFTESFVQDNSALQYLIGMSSYQQFEVRFMPLLDQTKLDIEPIGKYVLIHEGKQISVVLEYPDANSLLGFYNVGLDGVEDPSELEIQKWAQKQILEGKERALPADIVVVSDDYGDNNYDTETVFLFSRFKDFIRHYLIFHKNYHISKRATIDEFFYYTYRHRCVFTNFQFFWMSVIEKHICEEYATALDNRLELFCICEDKIKIELYKTQNNVTAMWLKYHISYFVLLCTGILDNIAWIIDKNYGLQLEKKNKMHIDLVKNEFIHPLRNKSNSLATYISSQDIVCKILAIRELRDRIVHRDFIQTVGAEEKHKNSNYLMIDSKLRTKMIKAGFPENGFPISLDGFACIDLFVFLDYIHSTIEQIVDNTLEIINEELFGKNEEIVIWKMYGFGKEPELI